MHQHGLQTVVGSSGNRCHFPLAAIFFATESACGRDGTFSIQIIEGLALLCEKTKVKWFQNPSATERG
jgi:hypothetical protein